MKSGTASAGSGAESDEKIGWGAVTGRVHDTSTGANKENSLCEWAFAGMAANGCAAGVAALTQQSIFLQAQQEQVASAGWNEVWDDDIA